MNARIIRWGKVAGPILLTMGALACCSEEMVRHQLIDWQQPDTLNQADTWQKVRPYRFIHLETTGITSYVEVGGKEVAIEFAKDSDPRALQLLNALVPQIFLPNTAPASFIEPGKLRPGGIYVIGKLHKYVSWTDKLAQFATQEPYHKFTLKRWYIRQPILLTPYDEERMEYGATIERKQLKRTDFPGTLVRKYELRVLQRPDL